jgi:hypothetical protein
MSATSTLMRAMPRRRLPLEGGAPAVVLAGAADVREDEEDGTSIGIASM